MLGFPVVNNNLSLVIMNGFRLIAGCFQFIFGSRYGESTRSKFGVSAYSRINTVYYNGIPEILRKVRSMFTIIT